MDLKEELARLAEMVKINKTNLKTEEATKHALVLPFIRALGYDVFNPMEVRPEFEADILAIKRGEQVDYAILKDEQPILVIEAKQVDRPLNDQDSLKQLFRYLQHTSAKVGILTNGVKYQFYRETNDVNVKEFPSIFSVDITRLSPKELELLLAFSKDRYDHVTAIRLMEEAYFHDRIRERLVSACRNTDESFLAWMMGEISDGEHLPVDTQRFALMAKVALKDFCSANHEQETSPEPPKPNLQESTNLGPGEGWTSVEEYQITPETHTPPAVRFLTGEEQEVSSWRWLMIQVAEWLVRQGILSEADCPVFTVRGENQGYALVNTIPVHPNEANMSGSHELSNGLYVAAGAGDSREILGRANHLITTLGQDPSQVWLKTG